MLDALRQPALLATNSADVAHAHRFIREQLAVASARMNSRERRRLDRLTCDRDDVRSMSQFHVARAAQLAMSEALLAHFAAHRHQPDFRYWLGTFCLDEGVVHVGDGYLSRAALESYKRAVYKALYAQGIDAVLCVEVEILLRLRGESSPRFMYHLHAVCWRIGEPIRPRQLAAVISRPARFCNSLGAAPVMFTTNRQRARDGVPQLGVRLTRPVPTPASVAGLGRYLLKWPVCVKVRKPRRHEPGRFRLDTDRSKNSAVLVLALTEARSRLDVRDCVKGVGAGSDLRADWWRRFEARLR